MPRGRLYVILLVSLLVVLAIKSALTGHGRPGALSGSPGQRIVAPEVSLPLEPESPRRLYRA